MNSAPKESFSVEYNTDIAAPNIEFASFTHTFEKDTRLMGLPKAVVHASCKDLDDMILYVLIRKLDKDGKEMLNLNIPWKAAPHKCIADIPEGELSNLLLYFGPLGVLRASHREIDHSKSIHPQYPFHTHKNPQKIPPGEVVELEIGLWAMGIDFEAGESLRVQISGQYPLIPEYKAAKPAPIEERNKGVHEVHGGEKYPSRIILPFV
jgi:predicted acyl esterase